MLRGKDLLDAGKVICPDGKTFWARKSLFPLTERPFGPGKSLLPAGKTFCAAEKVFWPGKISILSGKDLLTEAGSHSGGEMTIPGRERLFPRSSSAKPVLKVFWPWGLPFGRGPGIKAGWKASFMALMTMRYPIAMEALAYGT